MKLGAIKLRLAAPKLKYLRWLGYVAAYLLAFVVFAYLSFPYDRLKQYVVSSYNAGAAGPADARLEIDSLTWSWRFPGIVAEGVRLVIPAPPAAEGEKQPPPQYLEAEEIFVSGSPIALLSGEREASFGAKALDGEISGWVSDSAANRRFSLHLDEVDPGKLPQLAAVLGGLPLNGKLSGRVDLDLPEANLTKAEGTVDVSAEELVLGDGKAKIQNLIELPPLHLGAFTLKATIAAGRVKLDECTAKGRDAEVSLDGTLRLRPKFENSLADLDLKFSFSEKYKTQSDTTKALFGQPDSSIPGLFDTATSSSLAKLEDGSYAARLNGPISRVKPKPAAGARRAARAAAKGRRSGSRRAKTAAAADSDDAADTEEAAASGEAEAP